MKVRAHVGWAIPGWAWVAMLAGCGPQTQAVIIEGWGGNQPMTLRVRSDWAAFAPGHNGVDRVLLSWPLPGARYGQPVYQLYLHVPAEPGAFPVGRASRGQHPVAGMFIQRSGRYAGRTDLVKGRLRLDGRGGQGPTHRRGDLIVDCRDGTRIAGRFDAVLSVTTVTEFEDRHRSDIREMTAASGAAPSAGNADERVVSSSPLDRRPAVGNAPARPDSFQDLDHAGRGTVCGDGLSWTDTWIEKLLNSAERGGPFREEVDCGCLGGEVARRVLGLPEERGPCYKVLVRPLGEEEVAAFIAAGPHVIPSLMKHVRDDRLVPRSFPEHPMASELNLDPNTVGQLACYLIEAILRKEVYFAPTQWNVNVYSAPVCVPEENGNRRVQEQNAISYERWYEKCFDQETQSLICPTDDLPELIWIDEGGVQVENRESYPNGNHGDRNY
jgi:hypothetical protein